MNNLIDPKIWQGCKRPGRKVLGLTSPVPKALRYQEWDKYDFPTYNQKWPSCVGHASANWFELILRRYVGMESFGLNQQLDGDAVWKFAREHYYDGSLEDGIELRQGFQAMIDMGIFPEGSKIVSLEGASWTTIGEQLFQTPLVQAHEVLDGWMNPNPDNGQIQESGADFQKAEGGHATMMKMLLTQSAKEYVLSKGSWGTSYGYHGDFMMSCEYWNQDLLDGPLYVELPVGWKKHDGWRKYVIEVKDNA